MINCRNFQDLHKIVMITSTTITLQNIITTIIITITDIVIIITINMISITITCEEASTKGGVCEGKPGKILFIKPAR